MSKLKTHKATAKRFRITKTGKVEKKACGQNHFNARENGKTGRNKKSDVVIEHQFKRIVRANLTRQ